MNIYGSDDFRSAIFDYLKSNLEIRLDTNSVSVKDGVDISAVLFLDGEVVAQDSIFIDF